MMLILVLYISIYACNKDIVSESCAFFSSFLILLVNLPPLRLPVCITLFICTSSLRVIIFESVGLASFPRVIASLPLLRNEIVIPLSVSFLANSFAVFNLSNKPISSSVVLKNAGCKRSTIILFPLLFMFIFTAGWPSISSLIVPVCAILMDLTNHSAIGSCSSSDMFTTRPFSFWDIDCEFLEIISHGHILAYQFIDNLSNYFSPLV